MLADADFPLLVMLPGPSQPAKAASCVQTFHPESAPKKRRKSIVEDEKGELEGGTGSERSQRESGNPGLEGEQESFGAQLALGGV